VLPDVGIVDILSWEVHRSAQMPWISVRRPMADRRQYSRRVLPSSPARIMLSRKSGLDGGLDELGKPELVAADVLAAVSGKEGS
jgi:hypothetical protein